MAGTTFAAIDVGSYNVSMEIFEISGRAGLRSLNRVRAHLELGKDTFAFHRITMEKLEEMVNILQDFCRIMKEYQVSAYRCCAKSAFREARNHVFAVNHIKRMTGIQVDVLSNAEQRFIGYKSIASRGEEFQKFIEKRTAIIDVGGGSVQISLFDKDALVVTQNLRLGSLRIRQELRPFEKETVHYDMLAEQIMNREIENFRKMYLTKEKIHNIILVGDFFTNLIFQNKGDLNKIESKQEFLNWYDHVMAVSPREIARELDMPAEISSVLIPTAVLYRKLIEELGAETIWLPGIQLTDGIAFDYGIRHKIVTTTHDFEKDILSASRKIAARYSCSKKHTDALLTVSSAIVSALGKAYSLDARSRLLLKVACNLHECGRYISLSESDLCAYNIIRSSEIIGLSEKERLIIANAVRYMSTEITDYSSIPGDSILKETDLILITQLTAILRLSEALDAGYMQKILSVKAVRKEKKLLITVEVKQDFTLEQGIFEKHIDFFEEIFTLRPVLKIKKRI